MRGAVLHFSLWFPASVVATAQSPRREDPPDYTEAPGSLQRTQKRELCECPSPQKKLRVAEARSSREAGIAPLPSGGLPTFLQALKELRKEGAV